MTRRQSVPRQWFIADRRSGDAIRIASALPRGSGILFLYSDWPRSRRLRLLTKLRGIARARGLVLVDEASGDAARVHNLRELGQARLRGATLIFLSPLFPTRSHPRWLPLSRMHAAALARLAGVPVIALGGMNAKRFRRIERLGFDGWAGIDAWRRDGR